MTDISQIKNPISIDVGSELRELYRRQKARTGKAMETEETNASKTSSPMSADVTRNIEVCAKLLEQIYELQLNVSQETAIASKDQRIDDLIGRYKQK